MTPDQLQDFFTSHSRYEYELVLNNNRSTFLNLLEKKRKKIRLSIHKLFLSAPQNILRAIQCFVEKGNKDAAAELRNFATIRLQDLDYSFLLKSEDLKTKGKFYDLKKILSSINEEYFQEKLRLNITWYRSSAYPKKTSFTFGSYDHTLRLIRINELLDTPFCPEYFLFFVIYHEMLHHQFLPKLSTSGRREVHSRAFLLQEKKFKEYHLAKSWEKQFVKHFFEMQEI